jgi:hypothetical protein
VPHAVAHRVLQHGVQQVGGLAPVRHRDRAAYLPRGDMATAGMTEMQPMRPMFCVPMWLPIAFTRTLHENVDGRAHLEGTEHQADGPAVRWSPARPPPACFNFVSDQFPPPFFGIDALLVRWHFGADAPSRVFGLRLRGRPRGRIVHARADVHSL